MSSYGIYFGARLPKCGHCNKRMDNGDSYARVHINRYATPYFHGDCLRLMIAEVEKCEDKSGELFKKHEEKIATIKAAKAAKKNKKGFSRQIIKDALKAINVKVSKIRFRNATWRDDRHHELNYDEGPNVWVSLIDDKAYITESDSASSTYNRYFWNDGWKKSTCIHLADTNALQLLGNAILKKNPKLPKKESRKKKNVKPAV